jgi:hypothetical protein
MDRREFIKKIGTISVTAAAAMTLHPAGKLFAEGQV